MGEGVSEADCWVTALRGTRPKNALCHDTRFSDSGAGEESESMDRARELYELGLEAALALARPRI